MNLPVFILYYSGRALGGITSPGDEVRQIPCFHFFHILWSADAHEWRQEMILIRKDLGVPIFPNPWRMVSNVGGLVERIRGWGTLLIHPLSKRACDRLCIMFSLAVGQEALKTREYNFPSPSLPQYRYIECIITIVKMLCTLIMEVVVDMVHGVAYFIPPMTFFIGKRCPPVTIMWWCMSRSSAVSNVPLACCLPYGVMLSSAVLPSFMRIGYIVRCFNAPKWRVPWCTAVCVLCVLLTRLSGFDDETVRHFCNGDGFRATHQLPPVHGIPRGSCGCWWWRKASPYSTETPRTCFCAGVQIPMEFADLLPAAVSHCSINKKPETNLT